MNGKTKVFTILGGAVVLTGIFLFFIKPKAIVTLRKDGTGTIQLGGSTKDFSLSTGADLTTWNGYELHVFGEDIWLRKWGRDIVKPDGTPDIQIMAV